MSSGKNAPTENSCHTIVRLAEHYNRYLWITLSFLSPFLTTMGVGDSDLKPKLFDKLARLNKSRLSHMNVKIVSAFLRSSVH